MIALDARIAMYGPDALYGSHKTWVGQFASATMMTRRLTAMRSLYRGAIVDARSRNDGQWVNLNCERSPG